LGQCEFAGGELDHRVVLFCLWLRLVYTRE
jgi:hypothetical protein